MECSFTSAAGREAERYLNAAGRRRTRECQKARILLEQCTRAALFIKGP